MSAAPNSFSTTALQIANPDAFRDKVRAKLTERFTSAMSMNQDVAENAALNLERGIYNYTLRESDTKNIVKKWDNGYFVQIYADRLRTVCINMSSGHVIQLIATKQIKAHELAFMSHQGMKPRWRRPPTISPVRIPNVGPPNARTISCKRVQRTSP